MNSMTYDAIAPLITDLDVRGRSVSVKFRCPVTNDVVQGRHSLPANKDLSSQVSTTVKRSLSYNLQYTITSMLRSVLGSGPMGRAASSAAYTALNSMARSHSNQGLSNAEQQTAIVAAFQSVSSNFVFDHVR